MSDRALATYYLQSCQIDTTRELLANYARLKGRKLPAAGRMIRDGIRSILKTRKAA